MVDASLRMAIVNLFGRLKNELGLSIVYITHDLATAYCISDNNIIMRKGEIVERGQARAVLDNPQHPYSRALKDAVLAADSARQRERSGKMRRAPASVTQSSLNPSVNLYAQMESRCYLFQWQYPLNVTSVMWMP